MKVFRQIFTILAAFVTVLLASKAGYAAEAGDAAGLPGATDGFYGMIALGSVVGLGLAALGGGIGMGYTVSGALNSMARNPGFYSRIFTNMLIGLALIESLVIYTLVIVLILLYANPLK